MQAFEAPKRPSKMAYLCLQQVRRPQSSQEDCILGISDEPWTGRGPLQAPSWKVFLREEERTLEYMHATNKTGHFWILDD